MHAAVTTDQETNAEVSKCVIMLQHYLTTSILVSFWHAKRYFTDVAKMLPVSHQIIFN